MREELNRLPTAALVECEIFDEPCIQCKRNVLEKKFFYRYYFHSDRIEYSREGTFCSVKCYQKFDTFNWQAK